MGIKLISVSLFCAGIFLSLTGSTQTQSAPLKTTLLQLEKEFNVAFSFAEATVAGIEVKLPLPRNNLQEILVTLTAQTNLLFQPLNGRYIAVLKNTSSASRDKICGYVRSIETGEPLEGATVQTGNFSSVVNTKGYFEINKSGDSLTIRSLGFQSVKLAMADFTTGCKSIALQSTLTMLQEVSVTDFVAAGIEKKVDGTLTVQSKVLGILPGLPEPDALQVLQYLPGIRSATEAAADINIRGGTNDQNLILIDGVKTYLTGHFYGLISGFNPHMSEKVTVTRNGTGAYYGDGVSGTIAIESNDRVTEKISGSAGMNMLYADANFFIPLSSKLSIQVAGRRSLPSGWQTPTYKNYFKRAFQNTQAATTDSLSRQQEFKFQDVNAKLLYNITPQDKVRLSFFTVGNDLAFDEKTANTTAFKRNRLAQRSSGVGLVYNRFWSTHFKTTVEAYTSAYVLDAINQNIAADQQVTQSNEVLETGVKVGAHNQLTKNLFLHWGYQFFETGVTNTDAVTTPVFNRLVKEVMRTQALFSELSFSNGNESFNARFGARGSYYGKLNQINFEPRLVINQKLNKNFSIEAQAERKTQPTLQVVDFQNDFLGVEKRRWILANTTDVPVLTSNQVSVGATYNNTRWMVTAEAYLKKVMGVLTSSQGFQNQFQFIRSSGNYLIRGVDVLANYRHQKSAAWLGYSLSQNDFEFLGLVPPGFANSLDIRHMVSSGVAYKISRAEISFGASWHSGRPYTPPVLGREVVAGVINYVEPNSSRLDNYLRFDFSARWFFYFGKNIRSHFGLSIWNFTDHENMLSRFYTLQEGTVRTTQQNGLALTPNLFLRVEF
jgi:hypothetical protein